MSADPFSLSSYGPGLATQSNDNFGNTPEFWTEWYCNPSDDPTRMSTAVSAPSPVGSSFSVGSNPPLDMARQSAIPRTAFIDPGCFSPVATESTAATTVDGDEKDGNDFGDMSGDRKRRKSSAGTRTTARDEGLHNTPRRKSMTEPARRERNRTAAAKCRAKSKVAEEELKETQRIERDRNLALRATVEELNNESLMLKHELLCHSDCNHPIINKYLSRAAEQISRGVALSASTPQDNLSLNI
ncbi:hypothetical protein PFICI_09336 [Pestalotiopsis fici W106-1]|uniref:BZIP domain-containing protein n=1 Tax=Pestalotiopsis fici (strain W106-1 / CGMCC3.15140) TaxID=1229662 RepID=W3X020_PESFW|nr:uncharacterized protein PFICI_09336 [Pestalotiopsis fici W106-1]ETS79483.1 hypothetical protein PFICI_09336 [Pestalotiopsis fici W106-1]